MKPKSHGMPDHRWCLRFMVEMEMAPHIAAHSLRVWQVAGTIARDLAAADRNLDLPLIQAGALLHDITKTRSLTTGENHAATARELLAGLGFESLGTLVGQHVSLHAYPPETVDETAIVNYADKRVNHDRVVTLALRGDYILATYGTTPAHRHRIRRLWRHTREIEQRIFQDLPYLPDDLMQHLDPVAYDAALEQFQRWNAT